MNHKLIHDMIIDRALLRDWKSKAHKKGSIDAGFHVEGHHILPKSLGGKDLKCNIAVLSLKEHFIVHLLLTKIYPEEDNLIRAFVIMCNRTEGKSAREYESQMAKYRTIQSTMFKEMWTDEMRYEASIRMTELAKDQDYLDKVSNGVKRAYAETNLRDKISAASKENWQRVEYRDLVREGIKNHWADDNNRLKASEITKDQNRKDPELSKKRSSALIPHQTCKSEEWKSKAGKWMNDWYKIPGNETVLSDRYFEIGNKFNTSRTVVNKTTGEEYRSIKYASEKLNINYSTIKKYIYNNNPICPIYFKEELDDHVRKD
jgi:hypothetical protein